MKALQVINRTIQMVDGVRIARYLAKISINEVEGYLRADQKLAPKSNHPTLEFYCDIPGTTKDQLTMVGVENINPTESEETPFVLIKIGLLQDNPIL